jgi:hypothetical protein
MRRLPLPVLGLLAAFVVAGCGQQNPKLIPQANADKLSTDADQIAQACSAGDRTAAQNAITQLRQDIASLPSAVDDRLSARLDQWARHIGNRLDQDCKKQATPTPSASNTPTPSPTETNTPSPSPTETSTATPTPTATSTATATATPTSTATQGPSKQP